MTSSTRLMKNAHPLPLSPESTTYLPVRLIPRGGGRLAPGHFCTALGTRLFSSRSAGSRWKTFLLTLLLLLPAPPAAAFQPGEQAPAFTLKDLAGREVSLADFRGQLVVLDLGTTWCPGCRYQNRELAKIDSMFDDNQVRILEIFMRETAETVRGFLKGLDLSEANALLDDGSVQKGYNVYLIPRVLIVDGKGRVRFDAGLTGADEIETKIRTLLAESKEVKEP